MKVAVIFLLVVNSVRSYQILALFPVQAKSHFTMYQRLLEGLAGKGHKVDVLSHFPMKKTMPRYTDLSLKGTMPDFVNNVTLDMFKDFGLYEQILDIVVPGGVEVCKIAFETDVVKNLKNSAGAKNYDLVITEIFGSDCMLGFGHLFKAPVISVISSVNLPWASDRIGTIDNPSYIPNYFSLYTSDMSLLERLHNTWMLIFTKTLYYFYSTIPTNELMREFFGGDIPNVEDLARNTSLILVNSHNSIHQSRPALPNFVEVGGLHVGQTKKLPKYLSDVINGDHKGVVYLSMGSMVVTESFDEDKLQGLFDAFSELPYQILWKADRKRFPPNLLIPKNIHFEPWMPQLDVLCDPHVKLFVTHGGLMGMQEAVYCGVPLLGIPLFADQDLNIKQSVMKGFAQKVAYDDITKETVLKAAKFLLDAPSVRDNIKKASSLFKDRQNSPLETAIYWVEYVIKHKGAPHLRSRGADLAWYQYHLIDVLMVVLTTTVILLVVVFLAVKFLLKKLCSPGKLKIN